MIFQIITLLNFFPQNFVKLFGYIYDFIIFSGWFGIRKDFCPFLLGVCPLLQEYGNISYLPRSRRDRTSSESIVTEKPDLGLKKIDLLKPVVPIVSLEMPD